VTSK
jgi:hypothetical protein